MKRLWNCFRNEKGAVDMPSVIVGVSVTAIIGAIATVSLMVVIPWFEAKQVDDAFSMVEQAEKSARVDNGKYIGMVKTPEANQSDLFRDGYFPASSRILPICVTALANGSDYSAYTQSKSGDEFVYHSVDGKKSEWDRGRDGTIPCSLLPAN